jgi:hypothetical protein
LRYLKQSAKDAHHKMCHRAINKFRFVRGVPREIFTFIIVYCGKCKRFSDKPLLLLKRTTITD